MGSESVNLLLPPGLLIVAACLFLFADRFRPAQSTMWARITAVVLFAAAVLAVLNSVPEELSQAPQLANDHLASTLCWLALLIGFAFAGIHTVRADRTPSAVAQFAMLLLSTAGAMITVRANDFVLLIVSLHLAVLPPCLLIFLSAAGRHSRAAAVKYAVSVILAVGLTTYGLVLLNGSTATSTITSTAPIPQVDLDSSPFSAAATVLTICGLAILLSAVPFHHLAVEVADGSPAWSAGLVVLLPKIAAGGALLRLTLSSPLLHRGAAESALLLLATVSILGGNLQALTERRLHRVFAAVGIAQAGYLLFAAAVLLRDGTGVAATDANMSLAGSLSQLIGWAAALAGLFGALTYLSSAGRQIEYEDELTGLARQEPLLSLATTVCLLSLSAIAPLWGFWSRAEICLAALQLHTDAGLVDQGMALTAAVTVLGSLFSTAVAVRLIKLIYLQEPLNQFPPRRSWSAKVVAILFAACIAAGGIAMLYRSASPSSESIDDTTVAPLNAEQLVPEKAE